MSNQYLGEIRIVSFNFAPKGWALCNGALLPINQNQALFSILGTTFGGDGRVNFGLPDLRGRVPNYTGKGFAIGQKGGEEFHTLTGSEMPTHTHSGVGSSNPPNQALPGNNFWSTLALYAGPPANSPMSPNAVGNTGSSQPHENRSPYLTLNFVIAVSGIFPSRN